MKRKKDNWGGKRDGAGRKPINKVAMSRYTVRLSADQVKIATALGHGDLSEGVRIAIDSKKNISPATE